MVPWGVWESLSQSPQMVLPSTVCAHLSSSSFGDRCETPKHLFTFPLQILIKHLQSQPFQDGRRGPVFKINLAFCSRPIVSSDEGHGAGSSSCGGHRTSGVTRWCQRPAGCERQHDRKAASRAWPGGARGGGDGRRVPTFVQRPLWKVRLPLSGQQLEMTC